MAPTKKQRPNNDPDENMSSSDENEDMYGTGSEEMEMIEVDFDVKMPEVTDFHGIKNLLTQLFLKAHINTSELTDLLIHQKKITGVIKQADDDGMNVDEDDDDSDLDVTFGVFSVVNLTDKRNLDCVKQITAYLLSHCKKSSKDEQFQLLRNILENREKNVGLIISERMLNIPPKIAVPLYTGLSYDMEKATAKGGNFKFDYYILISKIVVFKEAKQTYNVVYANAEEELISEVATISFDFSVASELDSGLSGAWTDEDKEGHRKRRVMLFPASKYEEMCHKLTAELGT
ncbi:protein BCCIP homolog [Parasteatoda tepidariorum]|nr:protein BCCIP homolog [Parasteatoda tepidariorum]